MHRQLGSYLSRHVVYLVLAHSIFHGEDAHALESRLGNTQSPRFPSERPYSLYFATKHGNGLAMGGV